MTARGIRNFNPGNLDFNTAAFKRDPWRGELGIEYHPDARFTTFDTAEHGIRALCKILLTYQRKYNLRTVPGMINRWAPPVENDTGSYVRHVCADLGVKLDQEVRLVDDPEVLAGLAKAIIQHENGSQPYTEATIRMAVMLALA